MTIHTINNAATSDDLDDAVMSARRAFSTGRTRELAWRRDQLRGIERLCTDRELQIAAALAADLRRPPFQAWLGDIGSTHIEARYARKHVAKWMKPRRQTLSLAQLPGRAWVQPEPRGSVLIIGPWNYPFYLCLAPLVGAIAAGNTVVIKPSELAPATSALIAELVAEYLDTEAIHVIQGGASATQNLLAHGFDHVLFTGSTETGRKIMAAAAATLTPVTLELGGKSPVIVTADADLNVTARRIVLTKLLNSGQTCLAPDYVLADRVVLAELTDKIVATIEQFRSGEVDRGLPIVNQRQFDRLVSVLSTTEGTVVTGGGSDAATLQIEPTVIVDPPADDSVLAQEIFGPLLPIIGVDSTDAAVDFINSRPTPLALYVFTSSQRRGRALIDQIPSGGAVINHIGFHCLAPQLPFGGIAASGMGAYHGKWGFDTFSHHRGVLAKPTKPDVSLLYPPYTKRAIAIMRAVFSR